MDANLPARSADPWALFADYLNSCERVLVVVGAGLSAPSGISTWRGANDKWRDVNIRDLASPKTFQENPVLVWTFYGELLLEVLAAKPNAAHSALTNFAKKRGGCLTVNQNVDGLLEHAGHPLAQLCTMHGSLRTVRCTVCDYDENVQVLEDLAFLTMLNTSKELSISDLPHCPTCSALLRPCIVWFGERLAAGAPDVVDEWVKAAPVDLVIVVGSSLRVYPATEFVENARDQGARLAVVNSNLEDVPASGLDWDDWFFEGDVAETLPMILGSC